MASLIQIQDEFNFGTDKGAAHNYLEHYDRLFDDYKSKEINILEIGILWGESLKLWSKYFENAKIYGIDIFHRQHNGSLISKERVLENLDGHNIHSIESVSSCSEEIDLETKRKEYLNQFEDGFFDIIIDDGQHNSESQIMTYNNFKSKVSKDGLYIIEDIKPDDYHLGNLKKLITSMEIVHQGKGDDILGLIKGEDI